MFGRFSLILPFSAIVMGDKSGRPSFPQLPGDERETRQGRGDKAVGRERECVYGPRKEIRNE